MPKFLRDIITYLLLKIASKINNKYGIIVDINKFFYTELPIFGKIQKWAIVQTSIEMQVGHVDKIIITAHSMDKLHE